MHHRAHGRDRRADRGCRRRGIHDHLAFWADALRANTTAAICFFRVTHINFRQDLVRARLTSRHSAVQKHVRGSREVARRHTVRYSLIVRTTLEVGRPSPTGPFTCFMIASS